MSESGRVQHGPVWVIAVTLASVTLVLAGAAAVCWWIGSWSWTHTGHSGGISYSVLMPGELHPVTPAPDESIPSQVGLKFRLDGQDDGGGSIVIGTVTGELAPLPADEVARQAREAFAATGDKPDGFYRAGEGTVGDIPATVIDTSESIRRGSRVFSRHYIFEARKDSPTMFITCAWNPVHTAAIDELCTRVAASLRVDPSPPS